MHSLSIYSLTAFFVMIFHQGVSQSILPASYHYDANGNMVSDLNKDIVAIHYNLLNLPDTIAYTDGRKIVYVYTATGEKIRQQVLDASGSASIQRDYAGDLLYENGAVRQVQHKEGRVVFGAGNPEYQYHLKDHLGNVRTTITSAQDTTEYLATMERERAATEELQFSHVSMRSPYTPANHTLGGKEVLNLAPGVARGAGFNLAVSKGDVVYLEVYAYYENGKISDDGPASPLLNNTVLAAASSIGALGSSLLSVEGTAGMLPSSASPVVMLLALPDADAEKAPFAYLNYSLFDNSYTLTTAGYRKVSKQGAYSKELLTLGPLEIKESGYLDVYLSNTGAEHRVYFDDLKVTHVAGPIVQEDGYDPFGMVLSGQHGLRYGALENRYLFNGKEQQTDHDLNWYDYGARMYDAALGRWHVQDPLAEKYASWSPYQYTLNNPVKFIDPDGRDIKPFLPEKNKTGVNIRFLCALLLLGTTNEGTRIWNDVANNRNVSVYIAPHEGDIKIESKKAVGVTWVKDWQSPVLSFPDQDPFSLFNGLDIKNDQANGRDVYLVLVSVDDILQLLTIAGVTAHELEAHINIRGKEQEKIAKLLEGHPELSEEELDDLREYIEHSLFGNATGYEVFLNGMTVTFNGHTPKRGSSAERVSRQLSEIYKQWQRIKEVQRREEQRKRP